MCKPLYIILIKCKDKRQAILKMCLNSWFELEVRIRRIRL